MSVIQNRLAAHAVTLDTANAQYTLNSFATTDFNSNTETVTSFGITNIIWTGGPWTILRGANVVFTTDGTHGDFDLASHGIALTMYGNATMNVSTANATSTLILKVSKQSVTLNPPA